MGNLLGGAAACVSGSFLILASDSTTVMRVLKIAAILGVYAAAVWWMQSLVRSRAERWSRG